MHTTSQILRLWLAESSLPQFINDLASIASILGGIFSIWTLILVTAIRKKYLFKARFPELRDSLKELASELNRLVFTFEQSRSEIQALLAKCDAAAANLVRKSSGELKLSVGRFRQRLAMRNGAGHQKTWVLVTLSELQGLIETLIHTSKDMHWE
jgi:hypothetical protein